MSESESRYRCRIYWVLKETIHSSELISFKKVGTNIQDVLLSVEGRHNQTWIWVVALRLVSVGLETGMGVCDWVEPWFWSSSKLPVAETEAWERENEP